MDIIIYLIVGGVLLCLLVLICGCLAYRACKKWKRFTSLSSSKEKQVVQSMSKPTATSMDMDTNHMDKIRSTQIANDDRKEDHTQNKESDNSDNEVIDGMDVTAGGPHIMNEIYVENDKNIDDRNEENEEREESVHDSYYERTHHLFHSSSSNYDLEFGGQTFEI